MQHFYRSFLAFCLTIFSFNFAYAEQYSLREPATGLYLGAQAIYGPIDYKTTALINGFTASSVSSPDFGFHLITGWNFNQQWGSELGMVYFGHISFNGVGTPAKTYKIYHNLVYLIGKYRFPIGNRFSLDVRGGGGYISRKGINTPTGVALKADEYFVPVYGLSANVALTPNWITQLTWLGAPSRSKYKIPSSNMIGLGFIYRFGSFFASN